VFTSKPGNPQRAPLGEKTFRVVYYLCLVLLAAIVIVAALVAVVLFDAASPRTASPAPTPGTSLKDLSALTAFQVPSAAVLIDFDHEEAWDGTDSRTWLFEVAPGSDTVKNLPHSVISQPIDMTRSPSGWLVVQERLKRAGKSSRQIGSLVQLWYGNASAPSSSQSDTRVRLVKTSTGVWILVERLEL